jgi:acetyl esterase/lipase
MMRTLSTRSRLVFIVLVVGIAVAGVAIWYFVIRDTGPEPTYADIYYTNESDPRRSLDIFLPADEYLPAPVVMMLHGGLGNKSNFREVAKELTPHGFAVVLPSYRIDPMTYEDGFCALAWVHTNADAYSLAASRVIVVGWSSGGGIAAEMATVNDPNELLSDCPHNAPADWLDGAVLLAAGSDRWEESGWRTDEPPVTWIDGNEPSILIMHGEDDDLVPAEDSQQLAALLEESGDSVELVLLPDAGHLFPVSGHAGYGDMLDTLTAFLLDIES